jgi:1-acyl-sn-glycerol-3-phosphate acyltransferase
MSWAEGLVPHILLSAKNWPYTIAKIETMDWAKRLPELGIIGIARGQADLGALRKATQVLREGHIIATALEGTRGRGEERRLHPENAKSGLIYLANKFDPPLPIVPLAVWGQNERTFPFADVTGIHWGDFIDLKTEPLFVRIGPPFIPVLEKDDSKPLAVKMQNSAVQLALEIQKLLPT